VQDPTTRIGEPSHIDILSGTTAKLFPGHNLSKELLGIRAWALPVSAINLTSLPSTCNWITQGLACSPDTVNISLIDKKEFI